MSLHFNCSPLELDKEQVLDYLHYLKTGVLQTPAHYQFVLGAAGGMGASIENLLYLKNLMPETSDRLTAA